MPTLRVVPDLPEEPEAVALAAATPEPEFLTSTEVLPPQGVAIPIRWFSCDDLGVGAAVRAHVLTSLNAWAVESDTMADAMVMVSELVTNVRDHTASDALGVRVRITADRLVVAVLECDASNAPVGGRLRAGDEDVPGGPLHDRGRGLRILDSMAAEWGFVRRGGVTTTWFALPATSPVLPGREPDIRRF